MCWAGSNGRALFAHYEGILPRKSAILSSRFGRRMSSQWVSHMTAMALHRASTRCCPVILVTLISRKVTSSSVASYVSEFVTKECRTYDDRPSGKWCGISATSHGYGLKHGLYSSKVTRGFPIGPGRPEKRSRKIACRQTVDHLECRRQIKALGVPCFLCLCEIFDG